MEENHPWGAGRVNKKLKPVLRILAILSFTGLLLSIAFNGNSRWELFFCGAATLCSYIAFFSKEP